VPEATEATDAEIHSSLCPWRTFFFTVALLERRRRLLTEHIEELRAVFSEARRHRPFTTDAIVVFYGFLPDAARLPAPRDRIDCTVIRT
jgi:hypothetical protein